MSAETASKLQSFIQASKAKGASDETLANLLIKRGWPADDVYEALGDYWSAETGVAVPEHRKSSESAREAFLYLLAFSTLCSWATALGSALFRYVDQWFPDPVHTPNYLYSSRSSVTWQMATMAVAFPIFLLVMRAIVRGNASHPEQLQSGVRRWLTYIALLGTAGTMIGDLIWFLNYLLSGEVTTRFVLKSLVVLTICGGIFLYYLRSLRSRESRPATNELAWHRSFAILSTVAVIAAFCFGFTITGSPRNVREIQADNKRVTDLRRLQIAIREQHAKPSQPGQARKLPADLQQFMRNARLTLSEINDPETSKIYGYRAITDDRFELCADFARRSETDEVLGYSVFWRHDRGRTCYSFDATQPLQN